MKTEFIPYEQALSMKELGFNLGCWRVGNPNGATMWKWVEVDEDTETVSASDVLSQEYGDEWTPIPTFSQAFRWFRENYNLYSEILLDQTTAPKFCFENYKYEDFGHFYNFRIGEWSLYRTYEEAELHCLISLIEFVKNGKS